MNSNKCWLTNSCKQLHCNDEGGCLILTKLDYLFEHANIPVAQRMHRELRCDADGTDVDKFIRLKSIQDNILDFVDNGNNLYLYSIQAGNGKTSWSLRLVQTYFKKIWLKTDLRCRALFVNVPSFLLDLKSNISNPTDEFRYLMKNIKDCDLVIWDDIGNKVGTDYEINNLLSIINARLDAKKSNIYTSNARPQDLGKLLDIRLASRIANQSECIELKGGDKRDL